MMVHTSQTVPMDRQSVIYPSEVHWFRKEMALDMIQVSLGYYCTLYMLVTWYPSCSNWCFDSWVSSCLTGCQQAPGMEIPWDQGLAAVKSFESELIFLFPVAAIMPLASVSRLWRRWWFHLGAYAAAYSAQSQACKVSVLSPQSF